MNLTKISIIKKFKYELLVFVLFVVSHLPSLGYDIFNTDVWKWKTRTYNFSSGIFGLDFAETLQKYHPGVMLMWLGTIGIKLNTLYYRIFYGISPPDNNVAAIFTLHFFQKLMVVLALAVTVSFIFYALRKMFTLNFTVLFTLLLIFEPFYTALTRVFHLEGLMSTFMLASFVWLFYALNFTASNSREKNLVLYLPLLISAIFAGFAVLTKSSALFLLGFSFLLIVATNFRQVLPATKTYLIWLTFFAVTVVLFWPAIWVRPLDVIYEIRRGILGTGVEEGHEQFYFGTFVQDPGYAFYYVVFALRSSVYLIFGLLGFAFFYKRLQLNSVAKRFVIFALVFAVLYLLTMSIPSKKLDRYLLPSIIAMLLPVTFFYNWFLSRVSESAFWKKLTSNLNLKFKDFLLTALFLLPAFVTFAVIHPDYFSYYNPLFGGLRTGIKILEPKWIIGQHEITSYFEHKKSQLELQNFEVAESLDEYINTSELQNRLTIGFPEKYYTQVWPFIRKIGGRATIRDITAQAKVTKFFVIPVWEDDMREETRFKVVYIDSIYVRGVELYKVYERVEN